MTTNSQALIDAALTLCRNVYVLVLRLDLRAIGGSEQRRARSAASRLMSRVALASGCGTAPRVLTLLDRAREHAAEVNAYLEAFEEFGDLRGNDREIIPTARHKIAEFLALAERVAGRKPDLQLPLSQENADQTGSRVSGSVKPTTSSKPMTSAKRATHGLESSVAAAAAIVATRSASRHRRQEPRGNGSARRLPAAGTTS